MAGLKKARKAALKTANQKSGKYRDRAMTANITAGAQTVSPSVSPLIVTTDTFAGTK